MQRTFHISTPSHNGLCDITCQAEAIANESATDGRAGLVNVYVQGATAGIMI